MSGLLLARASAGLAGARRSRKTRQEISTRIFTKVAEEERHRGKVLGELLKHFDEDGSGRLEREELRRMLTSYAEQELQMKNTPTDDDLDFIFDCCGGVRSIGQGNLIQCIDLWEAYCENRDKVQAFFDKYDEGNDGVIDVHELANMLAELSRSPISDAEAEDVLKAGDVTGSGKLRPMELLKAICAWQWEMEGRKVKGNPLRPPHGVKVDRQVRCYWCKRRRQPKSSRRYEVQEDSAV